MGNSLRLKTLASAVSLALIGGVVTMPAHDALAAGASDKVANSAENQRVLAERKVYMIRFAEAGLMHYTGGVNSIAATAPSGSSRKLDVKSASAVAYLGYLDEQRAQHISAINAAIGRTISVPHAYAVTINGIASELSLAEAIKVKALAGVVSVKAAGEYHTNTFRGPEFIGADKIWDGTAVPGGVGTRGQGVVVGVIDTGSFAAHPSFANDATCGFSGANPKLISTADCLTNTPTTCTGTTPEAAAGNGHGVHTASTAVGNTLDSSAVPPPVIPAPFTTMSGVAPCAKLRTYKVCATTNCDGAAIHGGRSCAGDVSVRTAHRFAGSHPRAARVARARASRAGVAARTHRIGSSAAGRDDCARSPRMTLLPCRAQARVSAGRPRSCMRSRRCANDPQAEIRRIPPLLAQGRSEDRQAAQPRHVQESRGGGETRARSAVLQAARLSVDVHRSPAATDRLSIRSR